MRTTFSQRLGHELLARFNYEAGFSLATVAAGFATIVHLVWVVVTFRAFDRSIDAATTAIIDWDPSVHMMYLRIGAALLISVAGLCSRRVIGLFLSALTLVWVALEYVGWFFWSIRIKSNADIETFPSWVPHALNLYGGTSWNVVVLILVVAVLVWTMWRVMKVLKAGRIRLDGSEIG